MCTVEASKRGGRDCTNNACVEMHMHLAYACPSLFFLCVSEPCPAQIASVCCSSCVNDHPRWRLSWATDAPVWMMQRAAASGLESEPCMSLDAMRLQNHCPQCQLLRCVSHYCSCTQHCVRILFGSRCTGWVQASRGRLLLLPSLVNYMPHRFVACTQMMPDSAAHQASFPHVLIHIHISSIDLA